MKKSPEVGIGICIMRANKILLGERKNSHGAGEWSFPGGHLEMNETWEECAEREVFEETALIIRNIRFAGVTNDIFLSDHKHYITIFMLAEYENGTAKVNEPDRCDEWKWFDWDNLPEPLFLPVRNLLKTGFAPAGLEKE